MKSKEELKAHFRRDLKNYTKPLDDLLYDAYCLGGRDEHIDEHGDDEK